MYGFLSELKSSDFTDTKHVVLFPPGSLDFRVELALEVDNQDFPDGTVAKNPPASAGDTGLRPGAGRFHTPRSN